MGLLVKQLETNASVINEMTRSQLIDDYFTLAAHSEGLIQYLLLMFIDKNLLMYSAICYDYLFLRPEFTEIENALSFTKYLGKETQIVVWNTVFTQLRGIFNKLTETGDAFDSFKVRFQIKYGYWRRFIKLKIFLSPNDTLNSNLKTL